MVFIRLGWDDRRDLHVRQHLVDPVRSIAFVSCNRERPGHRVAGTVGDFRVSPIEQVDQRCVLMSLSRRDLEVKR